MQEQMPDQQRWDTLEAAVRDAVRSQPAEHEARTSRPKAGAKRTTILLLLLTWTIIAWIWSTRPAFLFGDTMTAVQSAEVEAASLRFAMFLERGRVEQYVRRHGVLPTSLGDAGPVEAGVTMLRTSDGYALLGQRGATQLRLTSAMSADSFLGSSIDVLRRAGTSPR